MTERPIVPEGAAAPKKRRAGKIAAFSLLGAVVVLGGVYGAGYAMAGEKLPKNTSLAGIELGGLTVEEAEARLKVEYADEASQPFTVKLDEATRELPPAEVGLSVDYPATVQQAGAGKSFHPAHIWNVLIGGGEIRPVVAVDEPTMIAGAGVVAGEVNREAKDATVTLEGDEITRTPGEDAIQLDQDRLAGALEAAYLKKTTVEAKLDHTEPTISDADVDEVVTTYVKPALASPIKVNTPRGAFEITPTMIGKATTITETDGRLVAATDAEKLHDAASPAIAELDLPKTKNASYKFEGNTPVVVPSSDGEEVSQESLAQAVLPVVATETREVSVEVTPKPATFNTEQATREVPKEVIGEFSTTYPHAAYRNTNLGIAADRINGHTLAKGEVFSLDEALGNRNKGYVDGWVLAGSRLVKANAGGISQSATTVYNAGWFAGLEDVEHQPHTQYFDRYPAGRESTIYSGSIDVKFRNTTDNAIYIQALQSNSSPGSSGSITVKIWGTKKWDIESPTPTKSGFYTGRTIRDSSASCNPQSASPGFTAKYYRLFKVGGEVVKREDKTWKYDATDRIICS